MVLGLLLRDEEEQRLAFDFEVLLTEDGDERIDLQKHRHGAVVGVGGATFGQTTVKKDFKRGTVVCRHWLRALCMKGDNCEFLHQYDMSKMPECRWGMECQVPECPFRHVPDEERVECAFYKQGFCSHGSSCRYRHIKLAREECPETADFALQSKVADEENVKRRKAQPVNEFFKIAICKHWEKVGSCPFGDECHFAHGDMELRPFPKGEKEEKDGRGGKSGQFGGFHEAREVISGPPLPDEGKMAKYFLVQSASYLNLAHSVHYQQWSVPSGIAQQIKMAAEASYEIFLFFTVGSSKHYQGVARVVNEAIGDYDTSVGEDLALNVVPYEADGKCKWMGAFSIEWLRICECPWDRLAQFENKLLTVPECPNGHELDSDTGHSLVRLLYNQPQIQLHYRSVEDEMKLLGGAEELATRRREAAESLFGAPIGPGFNGSAPPRWKVTQPGFVFTCVAQTIDECFGRMLFGLPLEQDTLAQQHVSPGTPLYLLNLSDQHLLGIFEAISPALVNMMPGAFCHGPNMSSPFPVQARFAVMLNAPALPISDPQIKQVLGDNKLDAGPLSLQITQQLADIFAERSGAAFPLNGPPLGPDLFRGKPGTSTTGGRPSQDGPKDPNEPAFLEKLIVGIENDSEFGVTRRIIGPAGSNMKRISVEAGGNAKIRVRGRGSGSKEGGPEDVDEPLMVLVSAENERSFRIACSLTTELLAAIHRDYQMFYQRGPPPHFRGGGRGPPMRGHF
ncbi:cleavage and polyadenylation specificity factor cpsf30-like [Plasmopara halstedii]|uniref:Cleavage and polyadenylation specificity factor cpsf30-like n=1 Tax=Plasmopara halstedii TaxID=4781 RepID=A0A0P1AE75_PLAHL|nr:cleavage and polyadenylation specificity factor cpsf30-like [Plasmopara halstedii]CEG38865.1 cleavage and polyadenylation specificity factor cpsf30-like [Plasmopara halstedii]|eukprot:XP_024575234.1 cleavage and polyadenylation specificity factor cpsf30-like [Plasmopara halstedii]